MLGHEMDADDVQVAPSRHLAIPTCGFVTDQALEPVLAGIRSLSLSLSLSCILGHHVISTVEGRRTLISV